MVRAPIRPQGGGPGGAGRSGPGGGGGPGRSGPGGGPGRSGPGGGGGPGRSGPGGGPGRSGPGGGGGPGGAGRSGPGGGPGRSGPGGGGGPGGAGRSGPGGRGPGGPGRSGPPGQPRQFRDRAPREEDTGGFAERVVYTRRIAKVVKGGRRLRFNALVVVGDSQGKVGAGLGKALVIPDAVRKGNAVARREMVDVPLRGNTIPQQITVKKGATIVLIKPAREGTGVIAAGAMRAILELGGVKDVVGKSLGSRNPINIVYATMEALRQLRDPETELAKRTGRPAPARAREE